MVIHLKASQNKVINKKQVKPTYSHRRDEGANHAEDQRAVKLQAFLLLLKRPGGSGRPSLVAERIIILILLH